MKIPIFFKSGDDVLSSNPSPKPHPHTLVRLMICTKKLRKCILGSIFKILWKVLKIEVRYLLKPLK